jgi:hypothetical protein
MPGRTLALVLPEGQPLGMSVDQLTERLRWLVLERQSLRERGATADELERNRLEIVRGKWQLANAAIELHRRPEVGERAA